MLEIHSKLKDPLGHHSLMHKNAIITKKHIRSGTTDLNQVSAQSFMPLSNAGETQYLNEQSPNQLHEGSYNYL